MTTTGFASDDYSAWGTFAVAVVFFLTLVGGCAGSTSGGFKVFRIRISYAFASAELRRILYPHGMFAASYQGRPVAPDTLSSVIVFAFLFAASFCVITVVLSAFGLDLVTSASGAATALAKVGPGIGETIEPAGNFASLPAPVKWVLAAGMLLGRLELITVLILFTPSFWRPPGGI